MAFPALSPTQSDFPSPGQVQLCKPSHHPFLCLCRTTFLPPHSPPPPPPTNSHRYPPSIASTISNCHAAAHALTLLTLAPQLHADPIPFHPSPPSLHTPLIAPPSYAPPSTPIQHVEPPDVSPSPVRKSSVLRPRVAVLLGVEKHWYLPLLFCRALSTAPAVWWGLRCALTFMGDLLMDENVDTVGAPWSVERRFRVTEVFLAVLWCCASAYLSFFFTDCLMSRWLLNYTPQATLVRLLTINSANAYITSWVLYLSGCSEDPRQLLPAWISIASTLTFLYHLTHPRLAILKETSLSISVFSIASFISMASLLLQLHLTRANDPQVPLFLFGKQLWEYVKIGVGRFGIVGNEL